MIFFCIADKDSSLGFRFSGIETREVSTRSESLEALRVALAMENLGVILITEKIADFIRAEIDKLIYQQSLPLILEIPSRGKVRSKKSVGEFLKQAIGVGV
jgi:V/A-type H+-transporting ATPase subunit F